MEELDDFLLNDMNLYNRNDTGKFFARGKIHGGSVGLTKFYKYNNITTKDFGFKGARLLKMSDLYYPVTEKGKEY